MGGAPTRKKYAAFRLSSRCNECDFAGAAGMLVPSAIVAPGKRIVLTRVPSHVFLDGECPCVLTFIEPYGRFSIHPLKTSESRKF